MAEAAFELYETDTIPIAKGVSVFLCTKKLSDQWSPVSEQRYRHILYHCKNPEAVSKVLRMPGIIVPVEEAEGEDGRSARSAFLPVLPFSRPSGYEGEVVPPLRHFVSDPPVHSFSAAGSYKPFESPSRRSTHTIVSRSPVVATHPRKVSSMIGLSPSSRPPLVNYGAVSSFAARHKPRVSSQDERMRRITESLRRSSIRDRPSSSELGLGCEQDAR